MSLVMVVDDEERVRSMLARSLTGEGHSVVVAPDGAVALEQLQLQDVDLVLLDMVMPGCSGLQVLEALQERQAHPPVIVVSAVEDVAARIQALDRGAVDYIGKPF